LRFTYADAKKDEIQLFGLRKRNRALWV
jgi:hypothetical protein